MNVLKIIGCISILLLGVPQMLSAQQGEATVKLLSAILEFQPNGELSILKSYCKNHTPAPLFLNYQLMIDQGEKGKSNRSESSGTFDIKGKQKQMVHLNTLDYVREERLLVVLKIFSDLELVAIDSLLIEPARQVVSPELFQQTEQIVKARESIEGEELPEDKREGQIPTVEIPEKDSPIQDKVMEEKVVEKTTTNPKTTDRLNLPQEDIAIDGLIIDETRSKMAHDFYDLFYRKWISPPGAADYIIYIKELPSRGRIARISLLINEEVVFQRSLSPRFDLLEQQVNLAINVMHNHLKKNENLKNQLGNEDAMGSGIF